eukprot:scaffold462361_cov63-Attheya_sp.AAC.1
MALSRSFLVVLIACELALCHSFVHYGHRRAMVAPTSARSIDKCVASSSVGIHCHIHRTRVIALFEENSDRDENDENMVPSNSKDLVERFDGDGFVGYLAPYALALLASVAITAAFFKFVLMGDM